MTTPWSSKTIPTAAPVAPGLAGPSKAMLGVAGLCAAAIAATGYLAFNYDRGSEGDDNPAAATSPADTDDSGDERSFAASDTTANSPGASDDMSTADMSADSDDPSSSGDASTGDASSGDASSRETDQSGTDSTSRDVDAGETANDADDEAAGRTDSDPANSGAEKTDTEKSDSETADSEKSGTEKTDSNGDSSDTDATKDESAAAVSPHEPQDDINDTTRRAIFSRGILFLRGEVPTQEAADTIVAKAIAVMGEDRVVVQYTINPEAELTGSAPFIVEDVVLFESGSNVINPQFEPILNFGIALLRQNERVVITVVGHTDSHGSTLANEQLAHARTAMVAQYWLDRGVPATQIEAVIKGESEPIADNSTPEGAQANRRVEFIISGILLD